MLKKKLKKLINLLGYDIRKRNILGARTATEYNTKSFTNKFYENEKLVNRYITNEVSNFTSNIFHIAQTYKINFEGKTLVDISCGTGHCIKEIQEKYHLKKIVGTEFSDSAIKVARQVVPNAEIVSLNIETQVLPELFDIILCQQVLEHLIYPEKALHNLVKMLDKKGVLIITIPDGRKDDFEGHINFWSIESFSYFLKKELGTYHIAVDYTKNKGCLFALINNN
jgi:ubiquinone/menaquinone biosynthesis C-methylase UbiE